MLPLFFIELPRLLGCCVVNPCYTKAKRISNELDLAAKEAVREKIYKCKAKENTPQKNTKKKAKSSNVIAYGNENKKQEN